MILNPIEAWKSLLYLYILYQTLNYIFKKIVHPSIKHVSSTNRLTVLKNKKYKTLEEQREYLKIKDDLVINPLMSGFNQFFIFIVGIVIFGNVFMKQFELQWYSFIIYSILYSLIIFLIVQYKSKKDEKNNTDLNDVLTVVLNFANMFMFICGFIYISPLYIGKIYMNFLLILPLLWVLEKIRKSIIKLFYIIKDKIKGNKNEKRDNI